jgi:hypothetical protein
MIKDAIILGLLLLLALAAFGTAERPEAVMDAPVVKADFPICVRAQPGPVVRHKGRHDNGAAPISEIT